MVKLNAMLTCRRMRDKTKKHHVLLHGYSSLPPRQLAGFRLFYRINPKAYALGYGKWRPAGSIY